MRAISTVLFMSGGNRPHGGLQQRAPTAGSNSGLQQRAPTGDSCEGLLGGKRAGVV